MRQARGRERINFSGVFLIALYFTGVHVSLTRRRIRILTNHGSWMHHYLGFQKIKKCISHKTFIKENKFVLYRLVLSDNFEFVVFALPLLGASV